MTSAAALRNAAATRAPRICAIVRRLSTVGTSTSQPTPAPHAQPSRRARKKPEKQELLDSLSEGGGQRTYPDPNEHCETCIWQRRCEQQRRDDDHLCLVAGISKFQINELTERGTSTMKSLAAMALPLDWKPDRGSADSYTRVREQARISSWKLG